MSSSNSTSDTLHRIQYGYVPTEWVAITFILLFGISTFVHTIQALRSRLWWLIPSVIFCGFLEVIGWSSRLWSSQNPSIFRPFVIQAITLVIAPTSLVAANFILLGRIMRRLGPQYSRLTPRRYTIIFVCCDINALLIQGMGGSLAAGSNTSKSKAQLGSNIALGGVIFQLASIAAYCAFAAEFLFRYARERPIRHIPGESYRGTVDANLKRMLYAMFITTVFIIIRTIYRTAEFVSGWNGKIYSTQWLFIVFDATMIAQAMWTLNIIHPGVYLKKSDDPYPTNGDNGPEMKAV
ncbi:RTA1 like protein-domain-containing protein [Lactifluus volemus]|nr:RTA1 like protein-domain-containing protein [Lactifluus volemus]